jgi:L-seryl-tRNA(Ser) seleniumtransferase
MARALRIDKLTLAALEATLRLYLEPRQALDRVPTLKMLALPVDTLQQRCEALLARVRETLGEAIEGIIVEAAATVGGGALPLAELPGRAIALLPAKLSVNELAARLRQCRPAVIGRIQDDRFMVDPRTLNGEDETLLLQALQQALQKS